MVAFSIQEKNVSAITELINHNESMSISSSADLFERADIHEYQYPGLVGNFFIFFFDMFVCHIFSSLVHSSVLSWLVHKLDMVPVLLLTLFSCSLL